MNYTAEDWIAEAEITLADLSPDKTQRRTLPEGAAGGLRISM